ncbi:unnamed protein product, partial [Prunus brigantina]
MSEFLQVIEPCVTNSDNENLLTLVSDFELECAIKSSRGAMAIKLDLEKAYDLLDWEYIKGCLAQFRFSDRISNLVFVDDCLIFARSTAVATRNINHLLDNFSNTAHSAAWKAILDVRSVLHRGIRWIVGNGQSIPFWTANWVFPFPSLDLIPVFLINNLNLNAKVSNFIQNQQSHPKAPLLKKVWSLTLPPEVKIFSCLLIKKRLQV